MVTRAYSDQRPPLQISQETWDREDEDKQRGLVRDAAALGYRLTVVRPDGEVWAPDPRPSDW